jgi:hypothetical protein
MNENDWVTIRVSNFFKRKFNWYYVEPKRISLLEKILRWTGFVWVIRINTKTNEVKVN